ncbi:putative membrane protein, partial [Yersinia pestis PY-113]
MTGIVFLLFFSLI